jgi:hypothetical protein
MDVTSKDVERFFSKVEKSDGCWNWKGGIACSGYGRFKLQHPVRHTVYAHRLSWVLHFGNLKEGLQVNHKCDNRRCVNPKHLYAGTQKENQQDMKRRGRHTFGEKSPNAKLTEKDVLEIYAFYEREKSTLKVAAKFGITKNLAWRIVRGLQWEHLYNARQREIAISCEPK